MIWLPFEDEIASKTEQLILKYNPSWTGANYQRIPFEVADWSKEYFTPETLHSYDVLIPFTQEKWRGRIQACRGMGASSIPEKDKITFDLEFKDYLSCNVPEKFSILHQILIEIYKKK
jgi:hypothetical protein